MSIGQRKQNKSIPTMKTKIKEPKTSLIRSRYHQEVSVFLQTILIVLAHKDKEMKKTLMPNKKLMEKCFLLILTEKILITLWFFKIFLMDSLELRKVTYSGISLIQKKL
jgi:hypothetical protein